jgi:hypothetical protein
MCSAHYPTVLQILPKFSMQNLLDAEEHDNVDR